MSDIINNPDILPTVHEKMAAAYIERSSPDNPKTAEVEAYIHMRDMTLADILEWYSLITEHEVAVNYSATWDRFYLAGTEEDDAEE